MAWETAYGFAFGTAALIFALFAFKAGEDADPITKEISKSGKIFRYMYLTLSMYFIILALGGAMFAAQGSPLSTNSTVTNSYLNVTVNETAYNATGFYLGSTIRQVPVLNSTITSIVSMESNAHASELATTGNNIPMFLIYFSFGLFLIGFLYEFFTWLIAYRNELKLKDR